MYTEDKVIVENGDGTRYTLLDRSPDKKDNRIILDLLPAQLISEITRDYVEGRRTEEDICYLQERILSKVFYQEFDDSVSRDIDKRWIESIGRIALEAAIELDNDAKGKDIDTEEVSYLEIFRKIIGNNLVPGQDMDYVSVDIQIPLLESIRENADVLETFDEGEYMMQLRLLYQDMSCISSLSEERKTDIVHFLCTVSDSYRFRREDRSDIENLVA